ncbi:class I SAM-dependent methyltransferase [Yersinia enterocolitica]|uniref:class I SAM-dependent methyltransferase n=1 Tax=Yersinia enterocolitica TaxID=630 RepID=UPI001C8F0000|nr:class I SAM-dependent methyltransferase [Yersinia enterocolitica]MBX9476067.1 class I SAM-dependent methyltransferase [Yersinia enterocolitica]
MADFYRAFEDKYRGSQASIKDRLKVYSPLIEKMKEEYGSVNSLDLGCGRGEWMSLLMDLGVETFGIDLDDSMLDECRIRNFSVKNADIISFLKACEAESYNIITAFHVVEHITFDDLCTVINNAIRVLKSGGILILETPNAENLIVGTNNFYLDPTHNKPVPALLLSFICEYYGLESNYIMRLQHPEGLLEKPNYGLYDVMTGVSLDYAVVAQKKDANSTGLNMNEILGDKVGCNLEKLSRLYDKKIESKFEENESNQKIMAEEITLLESKLKELNSISSDSINKLQNVASKVQELELIYNSTSWKLTAPFRYISSVVKKLTVNKKEKIKSSNMNFISFKESKPVIKIYALLSKISPRCAIFLKEKINELVFKAEIKNIRKIQEIENKSEKSIVSSQIVKNIKGLNHFEVVARINHLNMISTDHYITYIKDIIKTDGFQHLNNCLPVGTDIWILKIEEALYRNEPLENIFPENVENKAAATALYITLLKRMPENDIVMSKPIKHLCMVILQSEEYKRASGYNLKDWCDL